MKQPTVIIALLFATIFNYVQAQNNPFTTQVIDADPKLEMIEARQAKMVDTPPLLFVHGYRMGSWIFEDNYLPFFYDKGYEVFAINLRGHGWSEGAEHIEKATLKEYYTDLENAVAYIESETGETPLLIGFSMGAILTQKFMHEHGSEAAVLIGMGDFRVGSLHYRKWRERRFSQKIRASHQSGHMALFWDPAFQRALFFDGEEKPEGHKKYITKLVTQAGSKVIWSDLENFTPQAVKNAEVLIVAGEQDPFTPPSALQRARQLYNTELLILENTRHGVPVGENWKKGAKGILKFLRHLPVDRTKEISLIGVESN